MCNAFIGNNSVASLSMLPRLKFLQRCRSRVALLRWTTVLLCVASLVANLLCYLYTQPLTASLLLLQLLAMLGAGWHLRHWARSISLRPAELATRMLQVQESERQRLSRELHDDIGQLLTAAKLQVDWLQRRVPPELQAHCGTLRSTLDQTLGNVRDVSAILNPRQLASLGLKRAFAPTCCEPWKTAMCTGAWSASSAWAASATRWPWPPSASPRKP